MKRTIHDNRSRGIISDERHASLVEASCRPAIWTLSRLASPQRGSCLALPAATLKAVSDRTRFNGLTQL